MRHLAALINPPTPAGFTTGVTGAYGSGSAFVNATTYAGIPSVDVNVPSGADVITVPVGRSQVVLAVGGFVSPRG